jgi:DNA-binding NtrC family response regulator
MSGVEVLRELKQMDPAIEVIMLTAYETIETARQALRYGASDYLNKPFDIPTMREAVAKAFVKRRSALSFKDTAHNSSRSSAKSPTSGCARRWRARRGRSTPASCTT